MPDRIIAIPPWLRDKPTAIEPGHRGTQDLKWVIDTLGEIQQWLDLTNSELINTAQQHIWHAICDLSSEAGVYEATASDGLQRSDEIRNISQVVGEHNLDRMLHIFQAIADDPTTTQDVREAAKESRREAFNRLNKLHKKSEQPAEPIFEKPPIRYR